MKYLSLVLILFMLFGCSSESGSSITDPETSDPIYCDWITINNQMGFGDSVWEAPNGVTVQMVSAIKYEPIKLLITTIGVSGALNYHEILETDSIEYGLDTDGEEF